jgi:hypothetical protein
VTYYIARELQRSGLHPVREAKIVTVKRTPRGGYESAEEFTAGGLPSSGQKTER